MKTILLSIISTIILTLSYLSIEPLSSVYVQVKTIEILNKVDSLTNQNNQLKSRIVSLERRYDSLYLCNVELVKINEELLIANSNNNQTWLKVIIFILVLIITYNLYKSI